MPLGISFNPDMVVVARRSRGLSQNALARKLGGATVQVRLSRIENGMAVPNEDEITAIARALGYRREFFFHPVRHRASPPSYHRKRQKLLKGDWDRIYARAEIYRIVLAAMLRSVELDPKRAAPPPCDPEDFDRRIESIALGVREFWTLPRGPVADITKLVENSGIIIISFDFGTDLCDGFSQLKNEDLPSIIFVNKRQTIDRLRFTVAHELGHLIMHRMPNPNMENEANRFAAELPMPTEEIRPSFHNLSLEKFMTLKMRWMVSMQALIKKAFDLGKLNERMYRYYNYELSRRGQRRVEPIEIAGDIEHPRIFRQLLNAHMNGLGYSATELSVLFGLEQDEMETVYTPGTPRLRLVV